MAQFLAPIINDQQEDANGDPLSGGTIEVYLAGSSTPATTTSDKAGAVPNTWPIVLNTLGVNTQGAVWITGGAAYKYVIKNAAGVTQRTIDNVSGINDSTVTTDQWVVYQTAPTYVSATSFTVPGDQTQTFQPGRRVKTTNTGGTVYSTILSSVYGAPNTTVSVSNDSGTLDAGLSAVSYGLLSVSDSSLPGAFRQGQCRLVKSGANIVLQPFQGNQLTINGATLKIPSAGVSLAPTSLTPGTLYYIYAAIVSGAMVLEASTTGHSADTTTGVEIKTGDPTRTLVGMARPISGPAWADTVAQRFVVSWFNRRPVGAYVISSGALATASTSFVTLLSVEFLMWGDTSILFATNGSCANNTANATNTTGIGVDTNTASSFAPSIWQAYTSNVTGPAGQAAVGNSLAEGYHIVYAVGKVSGGTGSWAAPNGFELSAMLSI